MSKFRLGKDGWPTDEAVIDQRDKEIESLRQQLAESQAREKALRDGYRKILAWPYLSDELRRAVTAPLAIPSDSTALDAAIAKAKREALLEASKRLAGTPAACDLEDMAEELKGEQG